MSLHEALIQAIKYSPEGSFQKLPSLREIHQESRAFSGAVAKVLFGNQERAVYEMRSRHPNATQKEIAKIARVNGRRIVGAAESRIRKLIKNALKELAKEEGHEFLARDFLLRHFFPEILRDEEERPVQFQKLEDAGIIFTDDGHIDIIGSAANKLFVTIFQKADGEYISGFEMAKNRKKPVREVEDFLQDKNWHDLLIRPEEPAEREYRRHPGKAETIAVLRSPVNLKKLQELGHLRVGKDGCWHMCLGSNQFRTTWCETDEGTRAGESLTRPWGLPPTQDGMKVLFREVFGENLDFIKHPNDERIPEIGEEGMVAELQSEKNIANWREAGIRISGNVCKIYANLRHLSLKRHFHICGRSYKGLTVLNKLGIQQNRPGIESLCAKVFPGLEIRNRLGTNGTISLDETDFPEVIAELKQRKNRKILDRYTRDTKPRNFMGESFTIFGQPISMRTLLENLKVGVSIPGVQKLYDAIYGEEKNDQDGNVNEGDEE